MTVKEKLERIKHLDKLIDEKLADRERLLALATKCTVSYENDGTQNGTHDNSTEKSFIEYADFKRIEIDELTDELCDLKFQIQKTIDKLGDCLDRDMLKRYYIDKKSLKQISRELHYNYDYLRKDKLPMARKQLENL